MKKVMILLLCITVLTGFASMFPVKVTLTNATNQTVQIEIQAPNVRGGCHQQLSPGYSMTCTVLYHPAYAMSLEAKPGCREGAASIGGSDDRNKFKLIQVHRGLAFACKFVRE